MNAQTGPSSSPTSAAQSLLPGKPRSRGVPRPPLFEVGPKNYLDRLAVLDLARAAAEISDALDVDIIFTAPVLDVEAVKRSAPCLWTFSQAVDVADAGPSLGAILPDSLVAAGADGVMLNHKERPLDATTLAQAIRRCREAGLLTIVCADDREDARRIACLNPDILLVEPPDLIGTQLGGERPWIREVDTAVREISPEILVMHAGGIASARDVETVVRSGALGTGATSAIVNATEPSRALRELVQAVRNAWDERPPVMPAGGT
ncbi:triosephosphate isomerase (TIM) [Marmoricola sp. URHA0025 HA25]